MRLGRDELCQELCRYILIILKFVDLDLEECANAIFGHPRFLKVVTDQDDNARFWKEHTHYRDVQGYVTTFEMNHVFKKN